MRTLGPTAGLMSSARSEDKDRTGPNRESALVVEGGHGGRLLAAHLADEYDVTFVSTVPEAVERVERSDVRTRHVDEIDASTLESVGADGASLAVVASSADGSNLLAAQLLRATFGVERVVMLVNDPDRLDSLESLDVEAVCVSDLLATGVRDRLQRIANEIDEN